MRKLTAPRNKTGYEIALLLPCLSHVLQFLPWGRQTFPFGKEFGLHSKKGKQKEKLLQISCSRFTPARLSSAPWPPLFCLHPPLSASELIPAKPEPLTRALISWRCRSRPVPALGWCSSALSWRGPPRRPAVRGGDVAAAVGRGGEGGCLYPRLCYMWVESHPACRMLLSTQNLAWSSFPDSFLPPFPTSWKSPLF